MDNDEAWADLCEQYMGAVEDVQEARDLVFQKFEAIAAGTTAESPSEADLIRLERARTRRAEIEMRAIALMKSSAHQEA